MFLQVGSSYDYDDGYSYGVDSAYTNGGDGGSSTVHISGGGSSSSSTVHISGGGGGSSSTVLVSGGGGGSSSSSSSTITIGASAEVDSGVSVGGGSVSVGGGSVSVGGSSTTRGGSASAGTGAGGSIATGTGQGVAGEGDYTDLDGFTEEHITEYDDLDLYGTYDDLEDVDKDNNLPVVTNEYYEQVKNNNKIKHDLEDEEVDVMRGS